MWTRAIRENPEDSVRSGCQRPILTLGSDANPERMETESLLSRDVGPLDYELKTHWPSAAQEGPLDADPRSKHTGRLRAAMAFTCRGPSVVTSCERP